MIAFFNILFFLTILLCLSTYLFYPLVILLFGKIIPFKPKKSNFTPSVSILIAAYNEEKDIQKKLENTMELDYPKDKIEILVGSDGSKDRTPEIIGDFESRRIIPFEFKVNRGKTAVQNDLVKESRNDILVFTDAASFLKKDSLQNLVKAFSDPKVGAVAGCMKFVGDEKNLTVQSQGLYWQYEMKLRELESSIGRLIGVDGPLYAIRKKCYIHLQSNIISDLMTPLLVLKQGKKVVLDKDAVVYEAPTARSEQELNTRRRITLRGLIGIFSESSLLSPFKYPLLASQIIFHKLLRWGVGPLVLVNLLVCIVLSDKNFFTVFLFLHVLFYMAAIAGWISAKIGRPISILKIPYYFCLVNLAATLGIIDFILKRQAVSWKPVRH